MKFADLPEKEELSSVFLHWKENHPEVVGILVYGSRARGDHRVDSDLDVAVILENSLKNESPFSIWMCDKDEWTAELKDKLPWPLHLEWYDLGGSTPKVHKKIVRGYYTIYSQKEELWES